MTSKLHTVLLSAALFALFVGPQAVAREIAQESDDVQVLAASIGDAVTTDNYCHAIEVRIVVKRAALDSRVLDGIGFYSNFAIEGRQSPFFAGSATSFAGQRVTLKNGEEAVVLTFDGVGYCWAGSASSSMYQTLSFKPYARYVYTDEQGERQAFTNWARGQNSWIGGRTYPTVETRRSFDRSFELLQ